MVDISAAGSSIEITFGSDGPFTITDFATDGTPWQVGGDVDLSTNLKSVNGVMVSSRTPSIVPVAISVIPDGASDKKLREMARLSLLSSGNDKTVADIVVTSLVIRVPANDMSIAMGATSYIQITFTNGRMKTADIGPSTSVEGRKEARTYIFEFEDAGSEQTIG